MVQSLNNNRNTFGIIDKIGTTNDGRVVYQVVNKDGKIAGKLSVAQKDCDTFEKSYNDVIDGAKQLEKFASTHTEEDIKRRQKAIPWITGLSAFAGGSIFLFRKNLKHSILKTTLGTALGFAAGLGIAIATMTPPGAKKLSSASKTMSKLDIQPYSEK